MPIASQVAELTAAVERAGANCDVVQDAGISGTHLEGRQAERPLRITTRLVRHTIDDMNGILDHAPLATRVAWVRDLFERIDIDNRHEKAVAVWKAAADEGVNRSDSVCEWLRR